MKGIRFYNEYGDEFELHSFGHFGRYPNFYLALDLVENGRKRLCLIDVQPYFVSVDDCRRRVCVERGCNVNCNIVTHARLYPFTARINAGDDYFSLLRFLWRLCTCDDDFDEIVKWLNNVIDCALNGIF